MDTAMVTTAEVMAAVMIIAVMVMTINAMATMGNNRTIAPSTEW